jgi:hypothetical protein
VAAPDQERPIRRSRETTLRVATPATLDQLALVSASDIVRAADRWFRIAPVPMKPLLDATIVQELDG